MRVLVVSNMRPSADAPQRGSFVRAQVAALRQLPELDVELLEVAPGRASLAGAVREIRARIRGGEFDLVHAHYGLTGIAARAAGARPLVVTYHGTDVRHPIVGPLSRRLARRVDIAAGVSRSLFRPSGRASGLPVTTRSAVLPCGADLARFESRPAAAARRDLGLDPGGRYLFFPADPARSVKRADRASEIAQAAGAELLTAEGVAPERMADHFNAAAATLVTSDQEGFGLVAIESLACGIPVISTPVGIAPALLAGLEGCAAIPFDRDRWAARARDILDRSDFRVPGGGEAAGRFSAGRMAERVAAAYADVVS